MTRNKSKPASPPVRQFVRYWLPVIVYAVLIVAISSLPIRIRRVPFRYYDKVFHFIEYGIYAGLWYRAMKGTTRLSPYGRVGIAAFMICAAFGVMDELYQAYVPYRVSDVYDIAADAGGSLAAVSLVVLKDFIARP